MREIQASAALDLLVIAGAMHLSPEFGETWREIDADGFRIDAKVEMLLSSDTASGVVKSMGLGLIGLADALERLEPDLLVVLGDRFEALCAAQAALIMGVPLVHIHGGETTEGAYDDAIRHAISKMATIHFTATEAYRGRVIQMGEDPGRVFSVGALGLEHLARGDAMEWSEVAKSLGAPLERPIVLGTYHPATNAAEDPLATAEAMLAALDTLDGHDIVLTFANADNGGRTINAAIESFARDRPGRAVAVPSLGFRRYVAVLQHADLVVGNSSSGIIEAPSFGIPTVDIGERQRGRIAADSVIHCASDSDAIASAIREALSPDNRELARHTVNPYGSGRASERIVEVLASAALDVTKRFRDIA
jgi:UDP-N-acetylglucosamine 2-epimerase (non-hydrolysing)